MRNKLVAIFITILSSVCLISIHILSAQEGIKLGKVSSSSITEISGIVPYSYRKGFFWVHNDSGDGANVYLIDSTASLKVKVEIVGVKAIDIEDIAKYEVNQKKYLVLADMGNNLKDRDTLSLLVIEEPRMVSKTVSSIKVPLIKEIKFRYSDKKRDAEALFIDPLNHDIYIISKRDFESTVFSFPLNLEENHTYNLKPILTLPFTFTTAADISSNGNFILIKNLRNVFFWERALNQSLIETLSKKPKVLAYHIEPQGEAICFDFEKRFFYTISERPFGLDSYLYKYDY